MSRKWEFFHSWCLKIIIWEIFDYGGTASGCRFWHVTISGITTLKTQTTWFSFTNFPQFFHFFCIHVDRLRDYCKRRKKSFNIIRKWRRQKIFSYRYILLCLVQFLHWIVELKLVFGVILQEKTKQEMFPSKFGTFLGRFFGC